MGFKVFDVLCWGLKASSTVGRHLKRPRDKYIGIFDQNKIHFLLHFLVKFLAIKILEREPEPDSY
jgi:hypothetical protein